MIELNLSRRKVRKIIIAAVFLFLLVACAGQTGGGDGGAGGETATPTPVIDVPLEDLLVYVPGGPFWMGSQEGVDTLARDDEFPQHLVRLPGYFIYRDEVSNSLYAQCVAAGVCSPPTKFETGPSTHYGDPAFAEYPVVGVNWEQANAFCNWADARLPTEAEWEKTARGQFGDIYPWGEDQPACDLTNMEGCTDVPDTDKVGQRPPGESPYEADDLSGNVWEWTSDFYQDDYYDNSPLNNPGGPKQGDLRTVRGGSYEDGPVDLRAAARMGLDPNEAYNNVGFRCIPVGEMPQVGYAPFCQTSYVPFCNDPGTPPGEECTSPGESNQPSGGPDFNLLGFGCRNENGVVQITIDAGMPAASDYQITVGGNVFNCVDSTEFPGRLICSGPAPAEGTYVTIQACPTDNTAAAPAPVALVPPAADSGQGGLNALVPPSNGGDQLVGLVIPQGNDLQGLQPVRAPSLQNPTGDYCPEGMVFNPETQQCETDTTGDNCPEGWSYNMASYQCEPGENGCPQGTTYSPDSESCMPDDGQCPEGYYMDDAGACQPPGNNDGGGACPAGYFFDTSIMCCSPIPGDNNGCGEGYYYSAEVQHCVPTDDYGCGPNATYNPYEQRCIPDDNSNDDCGPDATYATASYGCNNNDDGCPEGTHLDTGRNTCVPDETQTGDNGCRIPGYVMNEAGYCVPPNGGDGNDCGPNGYYSYDLQTCVDTPPGECGPGYYYDLQTESCQPTTGPGSDCGQGYAYNPRLQCCSPVPGTDGSACPGDPQDGNEGLTGLTRTPTNYDPGQGYCDPGPDDNGCPPGYIMGDLGCTPADGGTNPTPDEGGNCPDGYNYDQYYNTCIPQPVRGLIDGCGEGQYFDYDLGYCVPGNCDNRCAQGYYYSEEARLCVPNRTQGGGCWTITQSVPVCPKITDTPDPRCPPGKKWQEDTETCEGPDQPNEELRCKDIGNQNTCLNNGCSWDYDPYAPGGFSCN